MKACSVPSCGKMVRCRGYCDAHYYRWRAHGDPLAGRTPDGEPLRFLEEFVLQYEGDACITWPYAKAKGYGQVFYEGKMQLVSRIVCGRVKGPPPTALHEAAHSCGRGDHGCCTKGHLDWKTAVENWADRHGHGTVTRGSRCGKSKLSEGQAIEVKRLLAERRLTQKQIGAKFGVTRSAVSSIANGGSWAWLEASLSC